MAMENPPFEDVQYFLLKMGIFQPVMLVFRGLIYLLFNFRQREAVFCLPSRNPPSIIGSILNLPEVNLIVSWGSKRSPMILHVYTLGFEYKLMLVTWVNIIIIYGCLLLLLLFFTATSIYDYYFIIISFLSFLSFSFLS